MVLSTEIIDDDCGCEIPAPIWVVIARACHKAQLSDFLVEMKALKAILQHPAQYSSMAAHLLLYSSNIFDVQVIP